MKHSLVHVAFFGLLSLAVACGGGDGDSGEDNGGDLTCSDCIGVPTGPDNSDPAASCTASELDDNACDCVSQSGAMRTLYLSAVGCI